MQLQAQIGLLSQLVLQLPSLASQKEQLEKDLSKKKEERVKSQSEGAKKYKEEYEKIETMLLNETGLKQFIPFYDLEKPERLEECLKLLGETTAGDASLNSDLSLDADDVKLLDSIFDEKLMSTLEKDKGCSRKFRSVEAFKRRVLETSIIFTMTEDTPEIGEFLHMPEMDPTLVRKYDKKIVDKCIKELIETVIVNLNVGTIEKILNEYKEVDSELIERIKGKLKDLRDYILGILGRKLSSDPEKTAKEWEKIETEHANFKK